MTLVTAAIIKKQGLVLIARKKKEKKGGGLWEFPGGKLLPGEKLKDGLRRELREELGIEAEIGELVGVWEKPEIEPGVRLFVFMALVADSPYELKDHEEILWVSLDSFPLTEFSPLDREIALYLSQKR